MVTHSFRNEIASHTHFPDHLRPSLCDLKIENNVNDLNHHSHPHPHTHHRGLDERPHFSPEKNAAFFIGAVKEHNR